MLKNADIDISTVDEFAVSVGPGSFTGLRIGISAVKGMAFGCDKPCVGVSTLHAAAYGMIANRGIICAVMDARCGQVYTATFFSDGEKLKRLCDDRAIMLEELVTDLKILNQTANTRMKGFFLLDAATKCAIIE